MTEHADAEKAAEEWAKLSVGEVPADRIIAPISYLTLWKRDQKMLTEGFLAGAAWAAPKWISLKERLPTKEEMEGNCIEWWHDFECCPFSGRYESYDGKRIWVGTRYQWCGAIPLSEFSYWRIVQEPAAPKEEK